MPFGTVQAPLLHTFFIHQLFKGLLLFSHHTLGTCQYFAISICDLSILLCFLPIPASLICIHHSLPLLPCNSSFCHKVSLFTFPPEDTLSTRLPVFLITLAVVVQPCGSPSRTLAGIVIEQVTCVLCLVSTLDGLHCNHAFTWARNRP